MNQTFLRVEPKIERIAEKRLIGKRLSMSLVNNRTGELWQRFMPRLKEIQNRVSPVLYSMQVYKPLYFKNFDQSNEFEKWAAVEVSDYNSVPEELETYTLPQGLYAVFHYKGASTDNSIFHYIFNSWLPASGYELDNRPHFEVLGEKYRNADPNSEEDIYIPVQPGDYASTRR